MTQAKPTPDSINKIKTAKSALKKDSLFIEAMEIYHGTQLTPRQLLEQRNYLFHLVVDLHNIANMPDNIKKKHNIIPVMNRGLQIVTAKIEGKHDI